MNSSMQIDPAGIEFISVGEAKDLPNGGRLFVEIDGEPIVVFNLAGQYFAIADLCSHDGGSLGDGDLAGCVVTCPRHGARFDISSGKALTLPAVASIPTYPVRLVDGQIKVGWSVRE